MGSKNICFNFLFAVSCQNFVGSGADLCCEESNNTEIPASGHADQMQVVEDDDKSKLIRH